MSEAAVISRHIVHEAVPSSVGRVLIIDDEAEIRESLETLLELEGYQVHNRRRPAPKGQCAQVKGLPTMSCSSISPCPTNSR